MRARACEYDYRVESTVSSGAGLPLDAHRVNSHVQRVATSGGYRVLGPSDRKPRPEQRDVGRALFFRYGQSDVRPGQRGGRGLRRRRQLRWRRRGQCQSVEVGRGDGQQWAAAVLDQLTISVGRRTSRFRIASDRLLRLLVRRRRWRALPVRKLLLACVRDDVRHGPLRTGTPDAVPPCDLRTESEINAKFVTGFMGRCHREEIFGYYNTTI